MFEIVCTLKYIVVDIAVNFGQIYLVFFNVWVTGFAMPLFSRPWDLCNNQKGSGYMNLYYFAWICNILHVLF